MIISMFCWRIQSLDFPLNIGVPSLQCQRCVPSVGYHVSLARIILNLVRTIYLYTQAFTVVISILFRLSLFYLLKRSLFLDITICWWYLPVVFLTLEYTANFDHRMSTQKRSHSKADWSFCQVKMPDSLVAPKAGAKPNKMKPCGNITNIFAGSEVEISPPKCARV